MTESKNGRIGGESNGPRAELAKQVALRLDGRRRDGETRGEVVERLLDETVEEVSIETIIDDLFGHFDRVGGIDVDVHNPEAPTSVNIIVYTIEVEGYVELVNLYDSGRYRAVIENEAGERFAPDFNILAKVSGPMGVNTVDRTCVYMSAHKLGFERRSVEDGLSMLRQKIGKSHDEIRSMLLGVEFDNGLQGRMEVRKKRNEILDEVVDLLGEAEEAVGRELAHIRRNINNADDSLLDDGKYNHDVRLALMQIRGSVESMGQGTANHLISRCDELAGALEERAELPPADEITRN